MTIGPDNIAAAPNLRRTNTLSVSAKLIIIIAILVFGSALGLFGVAQINKTATLHKLNFLHIKFNHAFFEHVTGSHEGNRDLQQLKQDLVLIRAQPIACIEVMGRLEQTLLAALGTLRALELCINDVALANRTLFLIEGYEQGIVDDKELSGALLQATNGFLANSEEFEPLVDKTATSVYKIVLFVLLVGAAGAIFFAILLIKSVAHDYAQISKTREMLRRYELIVSSATDMLALIDKRYVYLAANAAYHRAFGRSNGELLGRTITEVFGEDYFLRTIKPWADRCLAGENVRYQVWVDFPGIGRRFIDLTLSPYMGPDGDVQGFGVNTRDISDLEHAKAAIAESETRFRTVLETIGTGAIVTDAKGLIQIFNPAAEAIFGYSSDEVAGKNVSMLMPHSDSSRRDDYVGNYLRTGDPKIIGVGRQLTGLRKDGTEFPLQLEIGEMKIGAETGFVGSITDLTEIHLLEGQLRQSQKLEAVGQLTGGIAHDFNNLLAVVQGNLSLLMEDLKAQDSTVANEHMELVQPALDASIRGADLTQRLLAFSRKQTLEPHALDLKELVLGMEDMLRRTLGETIDLQINLKTGHWLALVDPSQMENALLNLVLNARDAMEGGGRLTLETADKVLDEVFVARHQGAHAGDYVMLAVSDTGSGIIPIVLEKVFDPFFTTKDVGKGSGLGLSMVHGFIKQSGGLIELSSEPGQGTSVKLYLPRSIMKQAMPLDSTNHSTSGGSETILVVENQPEVRQMTVRMLQRLGYKVLEAADGNSALEKLKNIDSIDLVLTDIVLPGGITGLDIAKNEYATRVGVKIMFMSGYAEDAIAHHGRIDDIKTLLHKPFSINELATRLREVLGAET